MGQFMQQGRVISVSVLELVPVRYLNSVVKNGVKSTISTVTNLGFRIGHELLGPLIPCVVMGNRC